MVDLCNIWGAPRHEDSLWWYGFNREGIHAEKVNEAEAKRTEINEIQDSRR